MAKYPVKMLKDEQNQPFVPLVSAESIYTNDDLSFEEKFATKLEADNLKEGNGIILEQNGNDTTISVDFGATDNIIDNLNTTVAGQGPLDARQGNVLKNMIPVIVDNLDSTDATKVLSANQGHELKEMSVPTGGVTGQVLKKASDNDHELEWGDAADPNAIVGDGSIMKIVELTYAEYKTLESNGELREDTEYHITDVENGTATYITEEQIQTQIENNVVNNLSTDSATKTLSAAQGKILNDKFNNYLAGKVLEMHVTNYDYPSPDSVRDSYFKIDGQIVGRALGRGHTVYKLNINTFAIEESVAFDTYGVEAHRDAFANYINSLTDGLIIVLTADACCVTETMRTALSNIGGNGSGTLDMARYSHYIVGMPTLVAGQGYEHHLSGPTLLTGNHILIPGIGLITQ